MKNDRAKERRQSTEKRSKRSGFTLVELIVTLVILSIVAAFAVPAFTGYIDRSRIKECKATREALAVKIVSERLAAEVNGQQPSGGAVPAPASFTGFDVNKCIEDAKADGLKCPSGGAYTYDSAKNEIVCSIGEHGSSPVKESSRQDVTLKDNTKGEPETEKVTEPPVTHTISVSITSPLTVELKLNGTADLTASVTVDGSPASSPRLSWNSSNPSVATVDSSSGHVTAVGAGFCSVTCSASVDVGGKTLTAAAPQSVNVTVSEDTVLLNAQDNIELFVGDTKELSATVTVNGVSTSEYAISWSSQNGSIASVEDNTVKGVAAGTCSLTASVTVNGKTYTKTVQVTVKEKETEGPPPETVSGEVWLPLSGAYYASGSVEMEKTTAESTPTGIVNITDNGGHYGITPEAVGTCTVEIKRKSDSALLYSYLCHVYNPLYNISASDLTLKVGGSGTVSVNYNPADATYQEVTYQVTGAQDIISLNPDTGEVTGLKVGTTTVLCTCEQPYDPGTPRTATATIKVEPIYVEKVTVELQGDANMHPGDERVVTAEISPANATYQDIEWQLEDNTDCMEIVPNTDGKTATIKAKDPDRNCSWNNLHVAVKAVTTKEQQNGLVSGGVSVVVNPLYPTKAHLSPASAVLYKDDPTSNSQMFEIVVDEPKTGYETIVVNSLWMSPGNLQLQSSYTGKTVMLTAAEWTAIGQGVMTVQIIGKDNQMITLTADIEVKDKPALQPGPGEVIIDGQRFKGGMTWQDFYEKAMNATQSYKVKNQLFYDVLTDAQGNEIHKAYVAVDQRQYKTYDADDNNGNTVEKTGADGSFEQFIKNENKNIEDRCFVEVQIDKMKTILLEQIESMKTDETILEVGTPVKVEIEPGVFEYYVACFKNGTNRTLKVLLTSSAAGREDKYWTKLELAE